MVLASVNTFLGVISFLHFKSTNNLSWPVYLMYKVQGHMERKPFGGWRNVAFSYPIRTLRNIYVDITLYFYVDTT